MPWPTFPGQAAMVRRRGALRRRARPMRLLSLKSQWGPLTARRGGGVKRQAGRRLLWASSRTFPLAAAVLRCATTAFFGLWLSSLVSYMPLAQFAITRRQPASTQR